MKTITFAMQKGGVGKTSISVSIAIELARAGKKTLLIDADPQGNATTWIYPQQIKKEFADVLLDNCTVDEAISNTTIENLFIIPTAGVDGFLKNYADNNVKFAKVKKALNSVSDEFDYCIIDTSPSFGNFERSVFFATNEIITVVQLDNFSKDGILIFSNRLQQFINDDLDDDSKKPLFNKIILNSTNESFKLTDFFMKDYKKLLSQGFELYSVPQDQAFKKAQVLFKPVQDVTDKKDTVVSLKDIVTDILK